MVKPTVGKKVKILVVDDNQDHCFTLKTLFSRLGHIVETCCCPLEVLPLVLKFVPEVILMDIGMPDMNGWEVAQQLRADPSVNGCKIYALTGYAQQSDREKSFEVGMNAHFVKPLEVNDFLDMLRLHNIL